MKHRLRQWQRRSMRSLLRRFVDRGIILLYHRVSEDDIDPWGMNVTPARFAEQMEALAASEVGALPLADAVRSLTSHRALDRFVSVTFDDGYADNLAVAKPIMEKLGIPATVYVPTTYVDERQELWWDKLQRLVLEPSTFPPEIELRIAGTSHRWSLGDVARYDDATAREHRHWRVWNSPPTERHRLYLALHSLIRPLSYTEQHEVLDALAGLRRAETPPLVRHPLLSAEEIRAFAEPGRFEVGAHSKTHPVLSSLSHGDQRLEIRGSRKRLEEIIEGPVTAFAYPYGSTDTYTIATKQIVRDARFESACANRPGWVGMGIDTFELPRFQVKDWDAREFRRHLRRWFRG